MRFARQSATQATGAESTGIRAHGEGDFWLKQIKNAAYSGFLIIIGLEMKTYRQKALQAKAVSPTDKNDTEIC